MEHPLHNALNQPVEIGSRYAYSYHRGGFRITAFCILDGIEFSRAKLTILKRYYFLESVRIEQKWDEREPKQVSVSTDVLFPISEDFNIC